MRPSHQPNRLLSLPLEIRLCIYRHVLLEQRQYIDPQRSFEDPRQNIRRALLRTCKQIYHEARLIFYSENTFVLSKPRAFFAFLGRIGTGNIALLRSLRIYAPGNYTTSSKAYYNRFAEQTAPAWYFVLNKLAEEATGLRHVYVHFGDPYTLNDRGPGSHLTFVQVLGRMKVSEKMEIDGLFVARWPGYLEKMLGMPVCRSQYESPLLLRQLRMYQHRLKP
jgi:hypothetical protein